MSVLLMVCGQAQLRFVGVCDLARSGETHLLLPFSPRRQDYPRDRWQLRARDVDIAISKEATMRLLSLLVLLSLSILSAADIIARSICGCSSSTHRGYSLVFSYLPARALNTTLVITDRCVAEIGPGACGQVNQHESLIMRSMFDTDVEQDLTYLKKYSNTTAGHTLRYHRELFGPDEYEFDGSGRRKIPTKAPKTVPDVKV